MYYSRLLICCLIILIGIGCNTNTEIGDDVKPEPNRFTKVTLTQGMDEPMAMDFLPDDRIIIVERKGGVKIYDENAEMITLVSTIEVNTKYTNAEGRVREAEEGLMGVVAHPNFSENNWVFLYYADPEEPKHVLARWKLVGNELLESSKVVVLDVPTQRQECCHTGGGMVFDVKGNLYLTVGNNTVNPRSGASNLDERPGQEYSDDQRGPSNSNDLRGKILRIHPEDDGSYSIPEGNLFPVGTANTRPEIYTMGHRNPWRVSLDSKTGFLYWGEVGPDANKDSIWGPRGYDEFNQAREAGFFGWPYFVGKNRPYNAVTGYEDESIIYGDPFDVNHVVNNSVNNSGIKELPSPVPAFIAYPYGPSADFPLVGSAGRSATGGPVFRRSDFKDASRPFPSYYEGKWLIVDFMRDWIMAVTLNEAGDYVGMERFLPDEKFSAAIDMKFGPSGDLYVLEYGDAWFRKNSNSRLLKIEYNAGNRKPIVNASSNIAAGAVPFTAQFSSTGTVDHDDYDQDALLYQWVVTGEDGSTQLFDVPNPEVRFDQEGVFNVALQVTDTKGAFNKETLQVVAGNEPPLVEIDFKNTNRSFYFDDDPLEYSITIKDLEDGSIEDASEAAITFDYVPEGFDPIEVASKQSGAELLAVDAVGKNLIESLDCRSCHQNNAESIGPSYTRVAQKYANTEENRAILSNRIINGSAGIWGEHAMAAHPELTDIEATRMVKYILSIQEPKPTLERLPLDGQVKPALPPEEGGGGVFVLRAAYTDDGGSGLPALSGEDIITLRNPVFFPPFGDIQENTQHLTTPRTSYFVLAPKAGIGFSQIDLTGINRIEVFAQVAPRIEAQGGRVELRLDALDGRLIASSNTIGQKQPPRRRWGQSNEGLTTDQIKQARRKRMQKLLIEFEPIAGQHDLFLVFINEEANEGTVIMEVGEIEFYPTGILSQ